MRGRAKRRVKRFYRDQTACDGHDGQRSGQNAKREQIIRRVIYRLRCQRL